MKNLILFILTTSLTLANGGIYYGPNTYVHPQATQIPQLTLIQGVGPNNLHPVAVKNPGMDGYYIGGIPQQQNIQQNNNQMMQLLQMQMLQNAQLQSAQLQQYMQNNNTLKNRTRRRRNIFQKVTSKGSINTGLIGAGLANEFLNKDNKVGNQKENRKYIGGAFLLNNVLR